MGLKSKIIQIISNLTADSVHKWRMNAVTDQLNIMSKLVAKAANTQYGKDHSFSTIKSYSDFSSLVPINDYEGIAPYIEKIKNGEEHVLWPGRPKYFAKTSGTTSGVKYIPITKDSMPNHINTARIAMFNYFSQSQKANIFDGNVIFLSGSPTLEDMAGIPTGRLSGIVNHEIPSWVRANQLPTLATNIIEDWEEKLDRIVLETKDKDLRLISGIPPWVQMYYERLLEVTGKKTVKEVFPNYNLFMYGGVNFEPYRTKLEALVGGKIDSVETFPASEGFIAFQDIIDEPGLLLNTNSGIFFEFIPLENIDADAPTRLHLGQVELGVDYALIINNNAGLFGYNIGDCIRFVSLNPYRLLVTGRVKHYISAFGEHVIGKEVEEAILAVTNRHNIHIVEFTVAPQVNPPDNEMPYHEWFVEFDKPPINEAAFASEVDIEMRKQNIYYEDLISGNILQPLKIRNLQKDAFRDYMKTQGKLGGQNKVPRLSNDRKIADALYPFILK